MKKQTNQTAREHHSQILEDFLSLGTEEEFARTKSRMMLAAKIEDAMTAKNIGKKQLAEMMGQRPSVITKWLSGKHNFTVDTLTDIQRVLGVRLLALEEKTHPEITFKFTIESADQKSQEVSRTIEQVFSSIPLLHDILKAPTTTIRLQQNIPQA